MAIRIHKSGMFTTVQDLGRTQFLSSGVPQSGAMDSYSARMANLVLNNDADAATLEFTYGGAEIEITEDLLIAYSGDGAKWKLGKESLPTNRPIALKKGDHIKLAPTSSGSRTYLATASGWDVPEVMGSRSTYLSAKFGGLDGRLIASEDELKANQPSDSQVKMLKYLLSQKRIYTNWCVASGAHSASNPQIIRVTRGPEAGWFCDDEWRKWLANPFTVDRQSNRMGYTLKGSTIKKDNTNQELLSSAVSFGTIQITGSSLPILLMADCQTTGGYPRIAQVATVDLPICGQMKPGDQLIFKEITLIEAEKLYLAQESDFVAVKRAVNLKYEWI